MRVPFNLRVVRGALRRINTYLSRKYESAAPGHPSRAPDIAAAVRALNTLDLPDPASRAYLNKHLSRLARTLTLVPPPQTSGRVLELGSYLQITPFLNSFCGYQEIRGAHFGPPGRTDLKQASVNGQPFTIAVDCFNAERDLFPYPDSHFETVLCCELIEHLISDPMHLLLECRRVLEDGGRLLVTTPNVASLTSVARALHGYDNPQIYYLYSRPNPGYPPDVPHVREYTAFELRDALVAAGFEIETLLTEPIPEFAMNLPMWNFLEEHGYNTSHRGEQTYCIAVKRAGLPVDRYPRFLYSD